MGNRIPDPPPSREPGGGERGSLPEPASCEIVATPRPSRSVLDKRKRERLISLLATGCSRRVAARWIGCAPSTISRAVAADPQFARQLARAEESSVVDSVKRIRHAGQSDRYWRAAAWFLERKNPDEFGLRSAGRYSETQLREILLQIVFMLSAEVPQEYYDRIMAKMDALIAELVELDPPLQTIITAAALPPAGEFPSPAEIAGGSASAEDVW